MANFFKISEAASLAIHAMLCISETPDRRVSIKEIVSRFKVSENHLAKVLQRLARVGLVRSTRGPKGGFMLAKPPEEIALLDVFEAIEGPLTTGCCLFGTPVCGRKACVFGGLVQSSITRIRDHMAETKLSNLIEMDEVQYAQA